jgi:multiple sugar transport system ATP-binding protein
MARVSIREVTKVFPNGVRALDALDVDMLDGEFFALLGPSGCGKTTLLRTIAGLESPSEGSLIIGDRDVTALPSGKRNLAMVFQDYALYPHMNVADNISYPLKVQRMGKEERRDRAEEAAGGLSLSELLERRPGQLSGGQQQRVALARAVACHPDVFLFDEPLSNLDARLRLEARTMLKRLQSRLGITTIFVTHDQAEAMAIADRMAVMEAGQIRQVGTPSELFHRPENLFVASFIGSTPMNLMEGTVRDGRGVLEFGSFALPEGYDSHVESSRQVTFGVRPEFMSLGPPDDPDGLIGTVQVLENMGTHFLVSVDVGPAIIRALAQEGNEPSPGDRVALCPGTTRVLVFDPETGDRIRPTEVAAA